MADFESETSVNFIDIWQGDLTDDTITNIAAKSSAEKGKKVKARFGRKGLHLTQSKFLKKGFSKSFPLQDIKTVTRNPKFPRCVMFILDDVKKYKIIGVRCNSDTDAIYLVGRFAQIQKETHTTTNIELKKRDNGNWTLRDRSTINANRHMAELFKENNELDTVDSTLKTNGDVNHTQINDIKPQNKSTNLYKKRTEHPKVNGTKPGYTTSKGTVVSVYNPNRFDNGEEDVIQTEIIDEIPFEIQEKTTIQDFHKMKGDVKDISNDMKEIKTILYQSHGDPRFDSRSSVVSQPTMYVPRNQQNSPRDYTDSTLNYEKRIYAAQTSSTTMVNPFRPDLPHYVMAPNFRPRTESIRNSGKVKFDQESMKSTGSFKPRNKRLMIPSNYSVPTTIRRPIEETYSRPVLIQRRMSAPLHRQRPASYHPVSNNELKIYKSYKDVAL